MEEQERVSLGFEDALGDVSDWKPTPKPAPVPAPREAVAAAAAHAGFRSREVATPTTPRGRRTGRNAQINIKARPDTIQRLYAISDRTGLGIAELFERAVVLMEQEGALLMRR
jgi:hypothetical protein